MFSPWARHEPLVSKSGPRDSASIDIVASYAPLHPAQGPSSMPRPSTVPPRRGTISTFWRSAHDYRSR